jgi:hypothetical protein
MQVVAGIPAVLTMTVAAIAATVIFNLGSRGVSLVGVRNHPPTGEALSCPPGKP